MGPGVEILYVKYLLNFHVYNTCHYNKKKLLTYLLTHVRTISKYGYSYQYDNVLHWNLFKFKVLTENVL